AKLVTLETVSHCMPAGILIGVVVAIFSLQHALLPAYALLLLIEKIAAVVKDVDSIQNKVNERLSAFNLQGGYFNSGVVFVNLKL
ncbi:hypothetical protein ONJ23_27675, partial [Salmonella enterica subsp. enterica serovar Virginia]|nr:hypothetical protein [Salmonella enterica subsp. enterica serovar Virginia]